MQNQLGLLLGIDHLSFKPLDCDCEPTVVEVSADFTVYAHGNTSSYNNKLKQA